MEYEYVDDNSALWQPQYRTTPRRRQNRQMVLVPAQYRGFPVRPYQSLSRPPYRRTQQPRLSRPFQVLNLQTRAPRRGFQVQEPQLQSFEVPNLMEFPTSHSPPLFQAQPAMQTSPPVPNIDPPSEELAGYAEEIPTNFDIDMPLLPDVGQDNNSSDMPMPTTAGAICCACGGHDDWKR